MRYKIESLYTYGWDDACWAVWTPEDEEEKPWRFETISEAQEALHELFSEVKTAVAEGNMDCEENPEHYRIVAVNDG